MKRNYIISIIILFVLSLILFFLVHFSKATILSTEGYYVYNDKVDEILLSEKKILRSENINLKNITYKDKFYTNLGKLYVGNEDKKDYVNDIYPVFSKDGLSVININSDTKLINESLDYFDSFENSILTDGKLYNPSDLSQADLENYVFSRLSNGIYINLYTMKINSIVNNFEIPVNSVLVFYESYIKYFTYDTKGLFIYNIVDGLDLSTKITMGDSVYSYAELLDSFNIINLDETEKENDDESNIDDTESDNKNSSTSTTTVKYVKPEVSVENFKANVYSATTKLKIYDPAGVITGGVNFQFIIDDKIFSRRAFNSSGSVTVTGLVPNTTFKIIGSYRYYNENKKKIEHTFFEQEITTLSSDNLESIELSFSNGQVYSDKIELKDLKITSDLKNEAINGISKAIVIINGSDYSISRSVLNQLINGKIIDYISPNNLPSNSKIEYKIKFLDVLDNVIKVTNNEGETRTSKKEPSVMLKRLTNDIDYSSFSVKLKNPDSVVIAENSYRYVLYDSTMSIKSSGSLKIEDEQMIEFDDLSTSSIYYLKIFGNYDIEDGKGVVRDCIMGDIKFTTLSLSTLGVIKLSTTEEDLLSNSAILKSSINFELTSDVLINLLYDFSVVITDDEGYEWYRKEYKAEEDAEYNISEILSESFLIEANNLYSKNNTYYVNYIAHVKQGDVIEEIEVECPFNEFKLLKDDAQVNITNFLATNNMLVFDVDIIDLDDAISEDYVTLKLISENDVYVDVIKITKNQKPETLTYKGLDYGSTGTFKIEFISEGYNIGYDSAHFESNKVLAETELKLNKDIFGTLQLESLQSVALSKNLFNINDDEKFRATGNFNEKMYDEKQNVLTLGAKNGLSNISYYAPDIVGKKVNVSFYAKYSKNSKNLKPVYFRNDYSNNINDGNSTKLVGLNQDDFIKYSFTFDATSPYVGFLIEELAGLNQTTYVDIKELMITTDLYFDKDKKNLNYNEYSFSTGKLNDNNKENGYAIINGGKSGSQTFDSPGIYEYKVKNSGTYEISLCGAKGAAGNGKCTTGEISLVFGTKLYFYVGEQYKTNGNKVFNSSYTNVGGSTDVRIIGGSDIAWDNSISLNSRIMIASGGLANSSTEGVNYISNILGEPNEHYIEYVKYEEKDSYNGKFNTKIGYKNNEQQTLMLDGNYYISVCNNNSCLTDGGSPINFDVIHDSFDKDFDKNKEYNLRLSFKGLNGKYYDIDSIDFSTISRIYAITSPSDFNNLHSDGRYIVLNDLDFTKSTGHFSGTFYGDIDFQGYKVIASLNNMNNFLIESLAPGTTIKNLAVDYRLDNKNNYPNYSGLFGSNSGLIDNVYMEITSSSGKELNTSALLSKTNAVGGVIKNFVIKNNTNVVSRYGFGLAVYDNYGEIKNGYVYGKDIDSSMSNTGYLNEGKTVGSVVAINRGGGIIRNIFSLISVKGYKENDTVGNIVGYNYNKGNLINLYSVEDSSKYNSSNPNPNALTKDPNIGASAGGTIKNVYYVSDNTYTNSASIKLFKTALYENSLQQAILNSDNAFDIDRFVDIGCFPQLLLNDFMPRQSLLFLPSVSEKDKISISTAEQLLSEANMSVVKLNLNNVNGQKISTISIDNLSSIKCSDKEEKTINGETIEICKIDSKNSPTSDRVWLLSQNDIDDSKTELLVQIYKTVNGKTPDSFKSNMTVNSITTLFGDNSINYSIEKKFDISFYYPIYTKEDWKKINAYPSGNFMLMNDLDFASSDNSASCQSLNRNKYCCSKDGSCMLVYETSPPGCEEHSNCYENISSYIVNNTFKGKLDGGNHKISNIRIKRDDAYYGFFNVLEGATIQNLYVDNYQKVNLNVKTSQTGYMGGFIKTARNNTLIDNVHINDAYIFGNGFAGGLIAEVTSTTTITNSSVSNVNLFNPDTWGNPFKEMGGMVGTATELVVKNSYVSNVYMDVVPEGQLNTAGVGGMIGVLKSGSLENVYTTGTIKNGSSMTGGVVGRLHDSASIKNAWSNVNIYSTLDYVGGIVGRRDSSKISNTIVTGEVSSKYNSNSINRTSGNTLAVSNNNYAWDGQKFNGAVTGNASIETLLDTTSLNMSEVYINRIGYSSNDFSFDNLSSSNNVAYLPLLKHTVTGKVLNSDVPYKNFHQKNVELKYDELTFNKINVDTENSVITIKIEDVNNVITQETIADIQFDYIKPKYNKFTIEVGVDQNNKVNKNIIIKDLKFERAYDAYMLEKIKLVDGTSLNVNLKIDYINYNMIYSIEDWKKYFAITNEGYGKSQNAENFKIASNLTELKIPNDVIYYGILIGRLEYDGQGTDGNKRVILNFGGVQTTKRSVFHLVSRAMKNIQIENINMTYTNTANYIGIICLAYGDIENVAFKNIKLNAPNGHMVGCFASFFGSSMSNVYILPGDVDKTGKNPNNQDYYSNQFIGRYEVAGLVGRKSSFVDTTNMSVSDTYVEASLSYSGYAGAIIGQIDSAGSNNFNYNVDTVKIKGPAYVGGAIGSGGARGYVDNNGNIIYSSVKNAIIEATGNNVGGFAGNHAWNGIMKYVKVENVTINAQNSNNVGGLVGTGFDVNSVLVSNVTINGNGYIGGLVGRLDSDGNITSSGINDSSIYQRSHYVGGILGYSDGKGAINSSYATNVKISDEKAVEGASWYVGGIAGITTKGLKFDKILANVDIRTSGSYIGGLFGRIGFISNADSNSTTVYNAILADSSINIVANSFISDDIGLFVGSSSYSLLPTRFDKILLDGKINKLSTSNDVGFVHGNFDNSNYQKNKIYITDRSKIDITDTDSDDVIYADSYSDENYYNIELVPINNLTNPQFYTNTIGISGFITSWTGGSVQDGYFAKISDYMPNISLNLMPALYNIKAIAPYMHFLPEIKVYSSDVDKINIEFSKIDEYTYFEVYEDDKQIFASNVLDRTYSFTYNYTNEFKVVLSDYSNKENYSYTPDKLINKVSVYGDKYAYIYDNKLIGNIKTPDSKFIHIFKDKALTDKGEIFDFIKQKFISFETELKMEKLVETKSLYTFNYDKSRIDTFGSYSIIHRNNGDIYYDNQIFVKNNNLEIIDSELDLKYNSTIVDEYSKKNYVTVLGLDGIIYNLKNNIKMPKDFLNQNIAYMSNNINTSSSNLVVMYENGKVIVFDYRTGKLITEKKATETISIIDYFKESFSTKTSIISNNISDKYVESLNLKSKIEKNPISDVNGSYFINEEDNDDESKKDKNEESINKSKYVVYYNSSKNNYDILNVNDVLNNENKSLEVTVENDKIYTSSDLVDFYMNKSIFEELFGNSNALIIFLIILVEVISLLILWFINIKKFKESST